MICCIVDVLFFLFWFCVMLRCPENSSGPASGGRCVFVLVSGYLCQPHAADIPSGLFLFLSVVYESLWVAINNKKTQIQTHEAIQQKKKGKQKTIEQ